MQSLWLMVLILTAGLISTMAYGRDDAETIRAIRMESNTAISNHNIASMKSFLADDYVITVSTGAIQRSRDEHIRSFAAHFTLFPDVVYVRMPTEIHISESYPLAIENGTWVGSRTTSHGSLENSGNYTAAWRKTENGWFIYSEIFVALYCNGEDC